MVEKKRKLSPVAWVLILSSGFLALFLIVSGALFLSESSFGPGKDASSFLGKGVVGIVELNGVIMDSKKVLTQLEKFEENNRVKAVVLRLNSPGGSVAPSQEIYEAVKAYKKPLVVSMGAVAASGAYYIACGAKKVYANPGTITASIGVIMEFVNLAKLYDWAKIHRYALKTGKYKGSGAEYRELTPEERELLQTMIDNVLVQFKDAVASGRKLKSEHVDAIADGRIMSGAQAKAAKLVDELGTLQDAINEAGKQAKIEGKPKVVYPEGPRRRLRDFLLDETTDREDAGAFGDAVAGASIRDLISVFLGRRPMVAAQESLTGLTPGIYWLWSGAR